jgi:hypothetical protein
MTPDAPLDLNSRFELELQAGHDSLRREAALAAFHKLQPSNSITVEEFLDGLHRHPDLWAVVGSLGITEFAQVLSRRSGPAPAEPRRRRTRISKDQKDQMKAAILQVFVGHPNGLTRGEVTSAVVAAGLAPAGIDSAVLVEKVRQPLHELVAEGKLRTVGEKRLMRYLTR